MSRNLIDLSLDAERVGRLDFALAAVEAGVAGMAALDGEQIRELTKMGAKSGLHSLFGGAFFWFSHRGQQPAAACPARSSARAHPSRSWAAPAGIVAGRVWLRSPRLEKAPIIHTMYR